MSRALFASIAALSLAAPLHHSLPAQAQQKYATEVSNRSNAAMAMLPMSTSSADARMHATVGQRMLDMGHAVQAQEHFKEAVAADPTSAFAQLGFANASTSFKDFDERLKAAAALAPNASRAEQLQIAIAQKTLVSDFAGAEALARELVTTAPKNPRSYLALANVQQQMGKEEVARGTIKQALVVAPNFSPALLQLSFSYMTAQPTDPAKAKPFIERLVSVESKEPQAFIAQGSFFRATNQLPQAREAYTRAAKLEPDEALPIQQRAHVESFLGNFAAARADYDAAIKLGKQNEMPTYRVFRSYVSTYEGNPKQTIEELDKLAGEIDGMNVADPLGAKIFALTTEAQIAIYAGEFESASRAIAQRTPLVREQVANATDEKVKNLAEADLAYYDGLLAARKGEATTAKAKADDIMRIVAETSDPQKNQPAHAVLGVLALEQKDFAGAAAHLAMANPNDQFMQYERALALDGAGKAAEAKEIFKKIARYNFNSVGEAFTRADATRRAQ